MRTLLWVSLVIAYAAFVFRPSPHGPDADRLDPMAPAARQVELALVDGRFDDALPLAMEQRRTFPQDPLAAYWLAAIYRGLDRRADEARAWAEFAALSSSPLDACPDAIDASRQSGDAQAAQAWERRCRVE
jgi:hypothetical protein